MRNFIFLLFLGFLISLSSCRSDFEFKKSVGGLRFSRDTVYLDTVFSNIGSSTYTLKVYNKSDNDISIPTIQLGQGLDSKYRITVDGMTGENGKIFHNVEMLAKDSMYIFIETTADVAQADPETFLYTDQILFGETGNFQDVDLVTLVQDAYFLYPRRDDEGNFLEWLEIGDDMIEGFILDHADPVNGDEYVFGNDKPYVIYGYAAVPTGETLTINAGARVHFHDGSGILVANGAAINVEGTLSTPDTQDGEVIFEGDRLEPDFSDIPGQWGTIWLTSGSIGNFSHATIKNGVIGLYVQNATLNLDNTQIYDNSNFGIYAQTATVSGHNVVVNSAGAATVACTIGGSYNFAHSTFNNNWQSSSQVALWLSNYYTDTDGVEQTEPLAEANFTNCIIFGSNQRELLLDRNEDDTFNYNFTRCQVRYGNVTNAALYGFLDDESNIIKNGTTDFKDINKNELIIGQDSDARNFGANTAFDTDILGNPRGETPDLGAYNSVIFED